MARSLERENLTVVVVDGPESDGQDLKDVERVQDLVDEQGADAPARDLDDVLAKERRAKHSVRLAQSAAEGGDRLPARVLPFAAGPKVQDLSPFKQRNNKSSPNHAELALGVEQEAVVPVVDVPDRVDRDTLELADLCDVPTPDWLVHRRDTERQR